MKFNHLNVPTHWQHYWTRFPEGHTILEALIQWVSQVDSMVDHQNTLTDNVAQFRNEIDAFVGRFDERLQDEVTQTLNDWQTSGFLDVVINEALQTQMDDLQSETEQTLLSFNTQLQQTKPFVFYDKDRTQLFNYLVQSETVTFVGDSLTEGGWFSGIKQYFPDTTFINKGVGGDTTIKVINRMLDVTATNADTYVIAVGTNDVRYRDPAVSAMTETQYVANCNHIYNTIKLSNQQANVVFVNAWAAFKGDYTSVLDWVTRDRMIDSYNVALHKHCANENIPFIASNEFIRDIIDVNNQGHFLVDAIHPNTTTGRKLYSHATLFGPQRLADYGLERAKSSAKHIYKLVIHNYTELTNLIPVSSDGITPTSVIGAWANINHLGFDSILDIFNSNGSKTVKPKTTDDTPTIILFSCLEEITVLRQAAHVDKTKMINNYELYYSTNPSDILSFGDGDWTLIKKQTNLNGKQAIFLDRDLTSHLVLSEGWSFRPTNISRVVIRDDILHVNLTLKKSSTWSASPPDTITQLRGLSLGETVMLSVISFEDVSGSTRFVTGVLNGDGFISVGWRSTNTTDDCVHINFSLPLTTGN